MSKAIKLEKIIDFAKSRTNNSKFTKSFIKQHEGSVPVYGASLDENEVGYGFVKDNLNGVKYFDDCLTWNIDGSIGVFFRRGHFSLSEKVIPLLIYAEYKDKIDLEYLMYAIRYSDINKFNFSNKAGKNKLKEIKVFMPIKENGDFDLIKQKEIARKYREVEEKKKILLKKAEILKTVKIDIPDFNNTNSKKIPLNYIIEHQNGKSLYTKEYCKNNIGKYPVFSANNKVPFAFLKSFDYNGEYLTYSKNGCAGFITILNGQFSINGDRCLIKLTEEYKEFDLQFLKYYLEPIFRKNKKGRVGIQETNEYTKLNSNMIKKLNIQVPIPIKADGSFDIDKQKEIANKFATVENIKKELYRQIMELTSIIVE